MVKLVQRPAPFKDDWTVENIATGERYVLNAELIGRTANEMETLAYASSIRVQRMSASSPRVGEIYWLAYSFINADFRLVEITSKKDAKGWRAKDLRDGSEYFANGADFVSGPVNEIEALALLAENNNHGGD